VAAWPVVVGAGGERAAVVRRAVSVAAEPGLRPDFAGAPGRDDGVRWALDVPLTEPGPP
jgi:hypothetical protein